MHFSMPLCISLSTLHAVMHDPLYFPVSTFLARASMLSNLPAHALASVLALRMPLHVSMSTFPAPVLAFCISLRTFPTHASMHFTVYATTLPEEPFAMRAGKKGYSQPQSRHHQPLRQFTNRGIMLQVLLAPILLVLKLALQLLQVFLRDNLFGPGPVNNRGWSKWWLDPQPMSSSCSSSSISASTSLPWALVRFLSCTSLLRSSCSRMSQFITCSSLSCSA